MKKLLVLFVLTMVFILLLSACAKPAPATTPATPTTPTATPTKPTTPAAPTPQYGGTIKIIATGSVGGIGLLGAPDEIVGSGGQTARFVIPCLEPLMTYDASEKFLPFLAESMDVAPDGKSVTLKLRKGIKFHDGSDFNAEAVRYNFEIRRTSKDPSTSNPWRNVTSIEALDDSTVRFNLKSFDYNVLLQIGVTGVYSATALKTPATPETQAKVHMVGTGPFKFVDYSRDLFVKYTKNTSYWRPGRPYADAYEYNQIADPVTAAISFQKGDAHLIHGISPTNAVDFKAAGFDIILSSIPAIFYLLPDGANADSPFGNIKVRQAVEYAIDKKSIATALGKGYYEALTEFAKASGPYYVQGLAPRDYNPEKAKQLLTEAGYPTGFKTTIISISTIDREPVVAFQTFLKAVGIDAALDFADAARFQQFQRQGWKNAMLFPGTPSLGNLSSFAFGHFPATNNVSMYRGDWQKVLDQAVAEPDYDKRTALLKQMVKLQYDDVMTIPIWARSDTSAAVKQLHDINWTQGGHPVMSTPADAWLSK